MSHVSVVFDPMQRYCKIFIDGERVGEFTDLAACEHMDLHIYGSKLTALIDNEVGEDYSLEFKGDTFRVNFMKLLAESSHSQYCEGISCTTYTTSFNVKEEVSFLSSLAKKYNLNVTQDFAVKIGGNLTLDLKLPFTISEFKEAELLFEPFIPTSPIHNKTVVVPSDHAEILNDNGMNLILLPEAHIQSFLMYFYTYCKLAPYAESVISLCQYINIDNDDRIRLSAYEDLQVRYIFHCDIRQCDVSDIIEYTFEVIPTAATSSYRILVEPLTVLNMNAGCITAIGAGEGLIRIVTETGEICEEYAISVVNHTYVTGINLMPRFEYLLRGEDGQIDVFVVPDAAEDAVEIQWYSSDNNIIHVSGTGRVTALNTGRATITASCRNCSASVSVEVRPALTGLALSETNLSVELGKSWTIHCKLTPENAAHGDIVWELDNKALGTIAQNNDPKVCQYTATTASLAKGTLTCSIRDSHLSATCNISVVPEDRPNGLITCTIIFTVIGLFFSFFIPLFRALGAGIAGYFIDFMLPTSLVLSLVGKSKAGNKTKAFPTCLILNLIFTAIMLLIAFM